ncbi:hypothetical protein AQI70_01700 [Streptomyces curacoi]|uniref:ArsR family transcriptional regulator n=1 Tax=Streptomyces curacoi TaxID=146536 RepID=A0A117PLY5_9ACTN|nr:helix-turn-helix domain-containing protein [Streptomyces curacoi]KUM82049.1 hypothetical protein AQI70_01700 [Streptomyces curacoi]
MRREPRSPSGGRGFLLATASQLAEQVDEAVSLVSYHLRKLAEHGLIEEAEPRSADGRERWWQPASEGVRIRDEDFRDAPEKAAAHTAASRLFAEQRTALYRRWLDERTHWGDEWNRVADAAGDTEGRENVAVHTYAFPFRT